MKWLKAKRKWSNAKAAQAARQGFLFLGGQLWLDFLNTQIMQQGERVDLLNDFADFVRWLREAQTLDESEAQEVLRRWPKPSQQADILEQARAFRSVLRAAAERITLGERVTEEAVSAINSVLQRHCPSQRLVWEGDTLTTQYDGTITEPVHLLAPVAVSAAESLTSEDLSLTRKCESPTCILHFHDTTKNHTRRWCRMETCGNRHKAAAHYHRNR